MYLLGSSTTAVAKFGFLIMKTMELDGPLWVRGNAKLTIAKILLTSDAISQYTLLISEDAGNTFAQFMQSKL